MILAFSGGWFAWQLQMTSSASRSMRRSLWLAIGLIGLGLLITRPQYEVYSGDDLAILMTEGSSKQIKGKHVYPDIHEFLNSSSASQVSKIEIHGFGLSSDNLRLLKNYKLSFVPEQRITGITDIDIPKITEGEEWDLKGLFYGEDIQEINLLTPRNNVLQANLKDSLFQIRSVAPIAGDYLYQLAIIYNDGDTLNESLPVTVHHKADWNMLVLSSYPSFEINYLKNYWTDKGYGFGLRLKIAADKYFSSFVNIPGMNLDRISLEEIRNFDFIMVDVSSWNSLSNVERNNILKSVTDDGLALLLRPDESLSKGRGINHPGWTDRIEKEYAASSGLIPYTEYSISSNRWTSLNSATFNLGSYDEYGLGHIFLIGSDDTYRLILANEDVVYQSIWSELFSALYRDFSPSSKLIAPDWIWEGEQTRMTISTEESIQENILLDDSISTPYLQIPFINGLYEITIWPKRGYNFIAIPESTIDLRFYAHPTNTWQSIRQQILTEETKRAVLKSQQKGLNGTKQLSEVPFYYWFAILLLGFGSLWMDETLFD